MFSLLRNFHARCTGTRLGRACRLASRCEVALGPAPTRSGRIELGEACDISTGVLLHPYGGSIRLGARVFLGPYSVIYGHGGVTIGEGTLVSMHCRILSSNHTLPPPGKGIRGEPDILLPTSIGPDVWLGAGVTILGGVTLGEGVVVGAGAVVTKDVPAHTVVAGVPARPIGHR